MKRKITLSLQFDLAIEKANQHEIVYRLKELRDNLMLRFLKEVLQTYDILIVQRLSLTDMYPNKARKGLVSCQSFNVVNNVIYSLHNQHRKVEYEEIYRDTYRR